MAGPGKRRFPALLADKGRPETVLVNPAANARDAMPHGGTLAVSAAAEAVAQAAERGRPAHSVKLSGAEAASIDSHLSTPRFFVNNRADDLF